MADRMISFREYGDPASPGIVLVHGGAAHGGWWHETAAVLADGFHVIVPDLSGHGDSEHSTSYGFENWAREVLACAQLVTGGGAAVLVGHSLGGLICLRAAARDPRIRSVVVVESEIRPFSDEELAPWLRNVNAPARAWPNSDDLLARFSLFDQVLAVDQSIVETIARQAMANGPRGWSWKVDRRTFGAARLEPHEVQALSVPVAIIRGEFGRMSSDIADDVANRVGGDVRIEVVSDAGHHVMLDQPEQMEALLRSHLAQNG
ncbi:alpha/beta fold hydrolase [Microbacterium sp. A588]